MKPDMQRARGFSLIELIIVIIVIGIVAAALAALAPLALTSLRAYDQTLGNLVVLDKLRYATERLAREIREVNYDPPPPIGTDTGFKFSSMDPNSMTFTRTFYDSGGTPSVPTTVTVGNTGTTVTLAYSTPEVAPQVLTDQLNTSAGLAFSYFDSNGVAMTAPIDPKLVRSVQILLTLTHNSQPYTQQTRVELKNKS